MLLLSWSERQYFKTKEWSLRKFLLDLVFACYLPSNVVLRVHSLFRSNNEDLASIYQ